LAKNINASLEPLRSRRRKFAEKPDQVWEILYDGADRARKIADQTMLEVREAIGIPIYREF
jgi:tryptophanyl-tRNA synthetase